MTPRPPTSSQSAPPLPAGCSGLDRHFAHLVERLAGGAQPELALAAALVSLRRREGHICLDLAAVAGCAFPDSTARTEPEPVICPALADWRERLRATPVVGQPGEFKPLILDARDRLYLHRYWTCESTLADAIKVRADAPAAAVGEARLRETLDRLFPVTSAEPDWQRLAAEMVARRSFCVISGGPGTGKTHTLARILALLAELAGDAPPLRFALAAPTGKAAARIQEALRQARAALPCSEAVKARLPVEAKTLHRLLEAGPDAARFRRNARNPLAADVVVVDEASMVDLALMASLFAAVPPAAKVILLGDKDQLASVEAGAVLGDICAGAGRQTEIGNSLSSYIVELRKSHRFGEASAISRLSRAINAGDAGPSLALFEANRLAGGEVVCAELPAASALKAALAEKVLAGFGPYCQAADPHAALQALARFRILCAVREGPFGVARVNALVEEILEEAGLIGRPAAWYARRPVMVTRNDYSLRLFNGDVGAILPVPETGELRAFFPGPGEEVRVVPPERLPQHETVFAMTVHKSQGSEFDRVLLVLPDRDRPLLTRELLYTGLTRARAQVELWCPVGIFQAAVARRVERRSGLREALWAAG